MRNTGFLGLVFNMPVKKTKYFFDIDGTCAHVGNRFATPGPVFALQVRGNPEFESYLQRTQTPDALLADKPVPGMSDLAAALPGAVYLTARDECYRDVTEQWLRMHNFPDLPLVMRPEGNSQIAAEFKRDAIRERVEYWYNNGTELVYSDNVVVLDDDAHGQLERICEANGWVFLKAKSGGSAI